MTDLTLEILREIRANQEQMKGDIAVIKDKMVQHSLQLASQGGSLGEIARILQHLPEWIRHSPADLSREMSELRERVDALERVRQ